MCVWFSTRLSLFRGHSATKTRHANIPVRPDIANAQPVPFLEPPFQHGTSFSALDALRTSVSTTDRVYVPLHFTSQGYKFMRGPVQKVLSDTIKERLDGTQYDPLKSAQIAKELADTVKERVKNLGYQRYKLVVQVTVGEKTGQALRLASRCLWDTATDNFASDFYENSSVFCVGMVFGLYYE